VSYQRSVILAACLLLCLAIGWVRPVSGDDWQPISPAELKMTSVPEAPGAPAVILYRQVDRDDSATTGSERNYVRIKILTEEGRKRADVEIPFYREEAVITAIKARTIRPDGSIANFEGKAFDKTIAKAKGVKYLAKTFTLPDVQVGSIIEYQYTLNLAENKIYDSHWILSDELFTKHAKFSLRPYREFSLRWNWPMGLPPGSTPSQEPSTHIVRLETQNIPAFAIEDFMPPENQMKYRVDFEYTEGTVETDVDKFWKQLGKKHNGAVEGFINKRKAMEQAVAQIVSPGDAPEVKAQKIYGRVQKLRNTSYEVAKTAQEQKRDKTKDANVEDLWRQQAGDGVQLTWLYLALVRAAGIEAYPVEVSTRNQYLFLPKMMNATQLNANVVLLKLNGKDVYCDPGTAFAPYSLLPWGETGVTGLKLDKDGGSWVTTTMPESAESRIVRKADLKMSEDGTLSGKVQVTFSGLEALSRRLEMRHEDDTDRKKYLEDQVREYVPVGIDVDLTNKPDWSTSAPTLVAEYDLKVPGWASSAGHRAIVPVGLFDASEKQLFEHTARVHPVYFHYPFEKEDEITIQLPLSWQVTSLPKPILQDKKALVYTLKVENDKGALHVSRTLKQDMVFVEAKLYPTLRAIYQLVRTGDEEQVMVQPAAAAAAN
jgi:Domain of Unknown Function with PDB structure (DUF3857)/Transglutaminase-like superfamily